MSYLSCPHTLGNPAAPKIEKLRQRLIQLRAKQLRPRIEKKIARVEKRLARLSEPTPEPVTILGKPKVIKIKPPPRVIKIQPPEPYQSPADFFPTMEFAEPQPSLLTPGFFQAPETFAPVEPLAPGEDIAQPTGSINPWMILLIGGGLVLLMKRKKPTRRK